MAIDPGTATLIAGGIGVGGSMFGASAANAGSAHQARQARNFEEMMYNQRYRKTVFDLRQAGLNPMLAYTQGPGATPNAPMGQVMNEAEGLGSTALDMMRLREDIKLMKENVEKVDQDTATSKSQQKLLEKQAHNIALDSVEKDARAKVWKQIGAGVQGASKIRESIQATAGEMAGDAGEKIGTTTNRKYHQPLENPWKKGQK